MNKNEFKAMFAQVQSVHSANQDKLEVIMSIKTKPDTHRRIWKRLAPIAACLVLAVAAVAVIPRLAARPGVEKTQQMTLPAMLAGQEVTWEAFPDGGAEPDGNSIAWFILIETSDGMTLQIVNPDIKIVGRLADGRKIMLATEEISREQSDEEYGVTIAISLDANEPIAVGATIVEYSHTDETGLKITYRCYIESIE